MRRLQKRIYEYYRYSILRHTANARTRMPNIAAYVDGSGTVEGAAPL